MSLYPLLAGDQALLVFVVRHERVPAASPDSTPPAPTAAPSPASPDLPRDVVIEVSPPRWAVVREARQAQGGVSKPLPFESAGPGKLAVRMRLPDAATLLVLPIAKEAR